MSRIVETIASFWPLRGLPGLGFRVDPRVGQPRLLAIGKQDHGLGRGLFHAIALGLVLQACVIIAPSYLRWIVDDTLSARNADLVVVLGGGFLLLVVIQAAITAFRSWVIAVLSTRLSYQWLGQVFAHLLQLPLSFFERRPLGDVVARFGSMQVLQRELATGFIEGALDGVLAVTTVAFMVYYSPRLAAIACCSVAIYALTHLFSYRAIRAAKIDRIAHNTREQTYLLDSVRGIRPMRLFGKVEDRQSGWWTITAHSFNAELRSSRLHIGLKAVNTVVFGVERVLIVWVGTLAIFDSLFSVGMLFAFIGYRDQFVFRATDLIEKLVNLRLLHLHAERVGDILRTPAEHDSAAGPGTWTPPAQGAPHIELRNVSFQYPGHGSFALTNLNLEIPPGQFLAVTGPSACGKSTLVKLLLGFIEPTEGDILVDGVPVRQLGVARYRQLVGAVMQEDQLFAGTLTDNITLFDACPDEPRMIAAARIAAIHDEIAKRPMKYGTVIGEVSAVFSSGQRQRILLARALYAKPRILVLDEAAADLDAGTEALLDGEIRRMRLTRVNVTHRAGAIAMADRVLVLDQGRIVRDIDQRPSGRAAEAPEPDRAVA
jgi:ATP-binding cassette subfamily B protein RaxB